MNNKKSGNKFETEFCEILSQYGFWVHNMAQNAAGQPADVIAVKDGRACLIDCKVCSSDSFPLSRIEDNQKLAMELWEKCGNGSGWFALKFGTEILMISYRALKILAWEHSSFLLSDANEFAWSLKEWVVKCR